MLPSRINEIYVRRLKDVTQHSSDAFLEADTKNKSMDSHFQYDPGQRLDDFEIIDTLFSGAMAEIYRAVDTVTREVVVIKVPSPDIINNPLIYYHFQNEQRVLSHIDHPRIVRLIQRDRSKAYLCVRIRCRPGSAQMFEHRRKALFARDPALHRSDRAGSLLPA